MGVGLGWGFGWAAQVMQGRGFLVCGPRTKGASAPRSCAHLPLSSPRPPPPQFEFKQVTLHNNALVHMDADPTGGFKKLNFLLQSPPFPPEAFPNLLLLYCKPCHAFYDLAADVIAENPQHVAKLLSKARWVGGWGSEGGGEACGGALGGRLGKGAWGAWEAWDFVPEALEGCEAALNDSPSNPSETPLQPPNSPQNPDRTPHPTSQ